jgi:hypothetical protein
MAAAIAQQHHGAWDGTLARGPGPALYTRSRHAEGTPDAAVRAGRLRSRKCVEITSDSAVSAVSARRCARALPVRLPAAMEVNVPCFPVGACEGIRSRTLEDILNTLRALTETAAELGKEAKESVEELGRSAGRRLDEARDEAGGALHSTASSVRTTGRQGSRAIGHIAAGAADRLDATASYIEDHELRDMFAGLRRFGRRHLTGSLVAAVAIGFFAGSALGRMNHGARKGA